MSNSKHKIAYILPEYNIATDTHYAYLYLFIDKVSRLLDIFLIVEKSAAVPSFSNVTSVVAKQSYSQFGRLIEGIGLALRARFRGYKDFYVHYSFIGAFTAIIVTKIFGGRVFYWNCGMPWLYKRGRLEECVFRFILRNSILVTGAMSLRDEYSLNYNLNKENSRILPNWIDLSDLTERSREESRKRLGINKDSRVVLFVHHLSQRKGSDKIVPVAEHFRDTNTVFLVVGDGPDKQKLEHDIAAHSLQGTITLIGKVPHRDIPLYFSASDVFFMPSEEEGFPHVILESMAYGVPYVASDVGAVREIGPEVERQFVITERTTDIFVNKLEILLEQPIASYSLSDHVQKFDISIAVKKFVEIIK